MSQDHQNLLVFIGSFAPGDDGAIQAYGLDLASGTLAPAQRTGGIEHPFFLAAAPDGGFLYSVHEPETFGGKNDGQVASYQIIDRKGELKLLNRQSAHGSATCYLDIDRSGRMLLAANYNSGNISALPIHRDGSLGESSTLLQHEGSGADPSRQEGPHAHCIVVSPDGRYAHAADLGIDKVINYCMDAGTTTLAPGSQPFVRTRPGAGPRHLVFHPDGQRVYVINELHNSVSLFDYDSGSGSLAEQQTISTLPDTFDGVSYCADLKITSDGRFLYATNRGHDSIACYRLNGDGSLSLIGIEPSLGAGPQNLAITPDDRLLLCANMPGNNVVVFRIDAETGILARIGEPVVHACPSCIVIL